MLQIGLDKICLAKFEQMGSQKKEAILQAKWAANSVKKSKIALTFWITSNFLLITSTQVQ